LHFSKFGYSTITKGSSVSTLARANQKMWDTILEQPKGVPFWFAILVPKG